MNPCGVEGPLSYLDSRCRWHRSISPGGAAYISPGREALGKAEHDQAPAGRHRKLGPGFSPNRHQPSKQQSRRHRPGNLRHHKPRHIPRPDSRKTIRQTPRQCHRRIRKRSRSCKPISCGDIRCNRKSCIPFFSATPNYTQQAKGCHKFANRLRECLPAHGAITKQGPHQTSHVPTTSPRPHPQTAPGHKVRTRSTVSPRSRMPQA